MPEIDAKKFYNEIMPTKQGDDYEYARWHHNAIAEVGYEQTKETIERFLSSQADTNNILELGPGAGTWSKLLRERYSNASMTLVDISKEMLQRAQKALGRDGVRYVESRFEDFQTQETYDLFLSSRVVEYIDQKEVFAQKLYQVLADGAQGLIITKMPHYARIKLQGKKVSAFHTEQIKPKDFVKILTDAGLTVVSVRPVTISVPLFKSAFLNRLIGRVVRKFTPNMLTDTCTESYAVVIKK